MNETKTPFQQAIEALGDTPESVTKLLREKSIKGLVRSACGCPIARYLNACGFPLVSVSHRASYYDAPNKPPDEYVDLPVGVRVWIGNFDSKLYPEFIL